MKHFIEYQRDLLELIADKLEIDYSELKKKAWDINQKKYEKWQQQVAQEYGPKPYKPDKPYGMSEHEFERLLNITEDEYLSLQGSFVAADMAYEQKLLEVAKYHRSGKGSPNPLVLKRLREEKSKLWDVKNDLSESLSVADNGRKLREKTKEVQ